MSVAPRPFEPHGFLAPPVFVLQRRRHEGTIFCCGEDSCRCLRGGGCRSGFWCFLRLVVFFVPPPSTPVGLNLLTVAVAVSSSSTTPWFQPPSTAAPSSAGVPAGESCMVSCSSPYYFGAERRTSGVNRELEVMRT